MRILGIIGSMNWLWIEIVSIGLVLHRFTISFKDKSRLKHRLFLIFTLFSRESSSLVRFFSFKENKKTFLILKI